MGLAGSGLVLQNNAADDLTIKTDGTFVFAAQLASGGGFDVTVKTQPMAPKQACVVTGGKGAIAQGNVTTVMVSCTTDAFTVGGTVSGLVGSGLVLQDNAGDPIPVNANGMFAFPAALADGSGYAVTVQTQPAGPRQTCSVTSGSGKLGGASVTAVAVDCVTDRFSVGGTVSGLVGTGLTLQDNGGDDLVIGADGTFVFPTRLADLSAFDVTIKVQPSGPAQACSVAGGAGALAGGNATSVAVTCSSSVYTIGGAVSGLSGSGLVLQNGSDRLSITANGTFAFATPLSDQSPYDVQVAAQPAHPSQTCTVTGGAGNVAHGAVSNISVTCTTNTYAVGGTLSGLATGDTVVLQDAGGDDLTLHANGAFTFSALVASGVTYLATVRTNPSDPVSQTCTVTSGSGTVTDAAIANIAVTCVTNRYTVGGTVTGLSGTGLVLTDNGSDPLHVTANGSFQFATSLDSGASYRVSIQTQPSGPAQTCVVTGGTGTVASGNVVSVAVNCTTDRFTVGGTVSGLDGVGLVLQDRGGDDLAINANGSFAFATPLADLSAYAVTVRTQPTSKSQTCTVSNGAGTLAGANVTNVAITCATNRFTIGGTVSGLGGGQSVVLQDNGASNLTVSANGSFTFTAPIASGSTYAVTVFTNPPASTCSATNGSGTVAASNVTSVTVSCGPICIPDCSGRRCGSDGCGGSCGTCGSGQECDNGQCVCAPSCGSRQCGPDSCGGGSCGTCPPGQECNGSGMCVCAPSCGSRQCGPDSCGGGSCGTCPPGDVCNSNGQCVCQPSCSGKSCGPDSCGGSCGTCPSGQVCGGDGTCTTPCVPSCGGRQCGSDGCGGSCGACPGNEVCHDNSICCVTEGQGCPTNWHCCEEDGCGNCTECEPPDGQCR